MENLDNLISNPTIQQLVQSYNDIKKSLLAESSTQMNSAIKMHTSLNQLFINVSTLFKQVTEKNNRLQLQNQRLTAAIGYKRGNQPGYIVKTEFKKIQKNRPKISDDQLYLPEDSEPSQQRLVKAQGNKVIKQEAADQQGSASSVKSQYDSQAAYRNTSSSNIKYPSIFAQPNHPSCPKKKEKLILKDEFANIHKYVNYFLGPCLAYDDNHKTHWILKKQVMQDYERWCKIQKRSPANIKMKLLQMEMTNQLKLRFPMIQTNRIKYEGLKFITKDDEGRFDKEQSQDISD